MSNTDGEDTQRIKLTPKDAGYKYFTCPMCDGHGQIGQDQHDQNNKDVEAQIETVQELASLREQLAKERELREAYKIEAENYNRHGIDTYEKLLKTQKQLKQKEDEIKILTQDSFNLAKKLVEKEDENRELVKRIESHLYLFDEHGQMRHELELFIQKHKKNLSA